VTDKIIIKGKVYDPCADERCYWVLEKGSYDVLHDALADFEGKNVRVIIEEI